MFSLMYQRFWDHHHSITISHFQYRKMLMLIDRERINVQK